jgi:hypothetical protein
MKKNVFFVLIAALLLAPWPVVYAYDGVNADSETSYIQPAETGAGPQMQAYGNAIGSVTPGDLFIVDMTPANGDTYFELIISNANELVTDYRFMNLKVGIFIQGADEQHWNRLTASNGDALPDIYITMFSGKADFVLPGGSKYKIVIDTGCFYCYGKRSGVEIASPTFYLTDT